MTTTEHHEDEQDAELTKYLNDIRRMAYGSTFRTQSDEEEKTTPTSMPTTRALAAAPYHLDDRPRTAASQDEASRGADQKGSAQEETSFETWIEQQRTLRERQQQSDPVFELRHIISDLNKKLAKNRTADGGLQQSMLGLLSTLLDRNQRLEARLEAQQTKDIYPHATPSPFPPLSVAPHPPPTVSPTAEPTNDGTGGKKLTMQDVLESLEGTETPSINQPGEVPQQKTSTRQRVRVVENKTITFDANGSDKRVHDVSTVFHYSNGDIETHSADKSVAYYYAATKVLESAHPDGSILYQFPNGQTERHYHDRKEIVFPNGDIETHGADDTIITQYANGSRKEVHNDGTTVIHYPNGDIETHGADDSSAYYYAATQVLQSTKPDGSTLYRYPNGRVETNARERNNNEPPHAG